MDTVADEANRDLEWEEVHADDDVSGDTAVDTPAAYVAADEVAAVDDGGDSGDVLADDADPPEGAGESCDDDFADGDSDEAAGDAAAEADGGADADAEAGETESADQADAEETDDTDDTDAAPASAVTPTVVTALGHVAGRMSALLSELDEVRHDLDQIAGELGPVVTALEAARQRISYHS